MKVLLGVLCLIGAANGVGLGRCIHFVAEAVVKEKNVPVKDRATAIVEMNGAPLSKSEVELLEDSVPPMTPTEKSVLLAAAEATQVADVNPKIMTPGEMKAIVAVLKTDTLDKKQKKSSIAWINDDEPLTASEAKKIAALVNSDRKLTVENEQVILDSANTEKVDETVLENHHRVKMASMTEGLTNPDFNEAQKVEVLTVLSDEILSKAEVEMLVNEVKKIDPRTVNEAKRVLDKANQKIAIKTGQDDTLPTGKKPMSEVEKAAVATIMETKLLPKLDQKELIAEVMNGQPIPIEDTVDIFSEVVASGVDQEKALDILNGARDPTLMAEMNAGVEQKKKDVANAKTVADDSFPSSSLVILPHPFPPHPFPPHPFPLIRGKKPTFQPGGGEFLKHKNDQIPSADNSVLRLMGERMKRYLHKVNHDKIRQILESDRAVQWVTNIFDENKDNRISETEWEDAFTKLSNYWQEAFKQEFPVPMEEWKTVDSNKDQMIDIKGEFYPALFSMTTEPLWRALTSAYFSHYDANNNGIIDRTPFANTKFAVNGNSEWEAYQKCPIVKGFMELPVAPASIEVTELDEMLEEVEATEGSDAEKKVEEDMKEVGVKA